MATHLDLYEIIKKQLPESIKPSFNNINKSSIDKEINAPVKMHKNTCGIFIRPTRNPFKLANGTYLIRYAGVTFNLFTGRDKSDLDRGYKWSEQIINNIDKLVNKKFTLDNQESIRITCSRRLRDVEQIWDENNVCCFIINYEIQYI